MTNVVSIKTGPTIPPLDIEAIRRHVTMIHRAAAPLASQGKLIVAAFGEDPSGQAIKPLIVHHEIGAIDESVMAIRHLAEEPYRNVYMPLVVVDKTTAPNTRGRAKDCLAVLGLVADMDAGKVRSDFPLQASFEIESSPGNFQPGVLFENPIPYSQAKQIARALSDCVGGDSASSDPFHVWRVPGTRNWPGKKKVTAGRSPDPAPVKATLEDQGRRAKPDETLNWLRLIAPPKPDYGAASRLTQGQTDVPPPPAMKAFLEALAAKGAFESYGPWIGAGMVLRDLYGEDGYELWEATFKEDAFENARYHWDSFGKNEDLDARVGIGSLYKLAKMHGVDRPMADASFWFQNARDVGPKGPLLMKGWLDLELPPREDFLGGILGRGSTWLVSGQTGIGKTNFALSLGAAIATGSDFLGWKGSGRERVVMYIDGEMGARAFQGRIRSLAGRYGRDIGLYGYNRGRAEAGAMPPLDREEGWKWLANEVAALQPDCIIFDSIRYLTQGNIAEEETWTRTGPVREELVKREIAQVWMHHTGHNKDRAYGSSQIAWGMEASVILTRPQGAGEERSAAFQLTFDKAREKTPDNWNQFRTRFCRLTDDGWTVSFEEEDGGLARQMERERDDGLALMRAMQENPQGPQREWALVIGRKQQAVSRILQRLKGDRLVSVRNNDWKLTAEGVSYLRRNDTEKGP